MTNEEGSNIEEKSSSGDYEAFITLELLAEVLEKYFSQDQFY